MTVLMCTCTRTSARNPWRQPGCPAIYVSPYPNIELDSFVITRFRFASGYYTRLVRNYNGKALLHRLPMNMLRTRAYVVPSTHFLGETLAEATPAKPRGVPRGNDRAWALSYTQRALLSADAGIAMVSGCLILYVPSHEQNVI